MGKDRGTKLLRLFERTPESLNCHISTQDEWSAFGVASLAEFDDVSALGFGFPNVLFSLSLFGFLTPRGHKRWSAASHTHFPSVCVVSCLFKSVVPVTFLKDMRDGTQGLRCAEQAPNHQALNLNLLLS